MFVTMCLGSVVGCVTTPIDGDSTSDGTGGNGKADDGTVAMCTIEDTTCPTGQICQLASDGLGVCEPLPPVPTCGGADDPLCPESQICAQTGSQAGTCIKEIVCAGLENLPCGPMQTCVLVLPARPQDLGHCEQQ